MFPHLSCSRTRIYPLLAKSLNVLYLRLINLSRKKHVKRKTSWQFSKKSLNTGLGPRTSNSLPRIVGKSQPAFVGVGGKDDKGKHVQGQKKQTPWEPCTIYCIFQIVHSKFRCTFPAKTCSVIENPSLSDINFLVEKLRFHLGYLRFAGRISVVCINVAEVLSMRPSMAAKVFSTQLRLWRWAKAQS